MREAKLGLDRYYYTNVVTTGEVPPGEMYALLVDRWGVSHDLAVALMSIFGGHIGDIQTALLNLEWDQRDGDTPVVIWGDACMSSAVRKCIKWPGASDTTARGDKRRMRLLLTQLAETGFVRISHPCDPVVEKMVKEKIAGLVDIDREVMEGVDPSVWKEESRAWFGLVPTKHAMRLAIAQVLNEPYRRE